jgi:hypothetical protein
MHIFTESKAKLNEKDCVKAEYGHGSMVFRLLNGSTAIVLLFNKNPDNDFSEKYDKLPERFAKLYQNSIFKMYTFDFECLKYPRIGYQLCFHTIRRRLFFLKIKLLKKSRFFNYEHY